MVVSAPSPGAEISTRFEPFSRCGRHFSFEVKMPVHSRTISTSDQGRSAGFFSDVTRIGEFSPETFEAKWTKGSTEPEVGATFSGHVKRNGVGPLEELEARKKKAEAGVSKHEGGGCDCGAKEKKDAPE